MDTVAVELELERQWAGEACFLSPISFQALTPVV